MCSARAVGVWRASTCRIASCLCLECCVLRGNGVRFLDRSLEDLHFFGTEGAGELVVELLILLVEVYRWSVDSRS